MIDKETKEAIASSTVPLILGDGPLSSRLAWRLYFSFGAISLRLGKHRRLTDLLGLACLFRRAEKNTQLLSEQLFAIAEEFDGYLLFLLPSDEPSRRFVEEHRELLESRFILTSPAELFSQLPCRETYHD